MTTIVSIDAHKTTLTYATLQDDQVTDRGRQPCNPEALRRLASRYGGAKIVLEACGVHEWMTDVLRESGVNVKVIAPTKAPRESAKSDHKDAERNARRERSGENREVFVPTPGVRRIRDIVRHRARLVSTRTMLKNHLSHELNRWGYTHLHPEHASTLQDRYSPEARELVTKAFPHLDDDYDLIDSINRKVRRLDKQVATIGRDIEPVQRLRTLKGFGQLVSLAFYTEIGDIRRFPNAEHLVSYVGLDPAWGSSGDKAWDKHRISKQGRSYLRGLLTEAAWKHTRYEPESSISQAYRDLERRKSAQEAIMKTARLLTKTAYVLWKENRDFTLKRLAA